MTASSYAIIGPTASGKSALALEIARRLQGEIISVDSVQVYRGFDIGAAKPSQAEQAEIPHHLIDICAWHDGYDAARFAREARLVAAEILARGKTPIFVGGTGLYFRALWGAQFHVDLPKHEGIRGFLAQRSNEALKADLILHDPERAAQIHVNDRFRLMRALELTLLLAGPIKAYQTPPQEDRQGAFVIYLCPPRPLLHQRIEARVDMMLAAGFVGEVKALLASGVSATSRPMQAIGYKEVAAFLAQGGDLAQLRTDLLIATRQYAKRQCTWFNGLAVDRKIAAAEEWDGP